MKLIIVTTPERKEAWRDLPRFCKAHGIEYREMRNAQQRLGKKRFPFVFNGYEIDKVEADVIYSVGGVAVEFEPEK